MFAMHWPVFTGLTTQGIYEAKDRVKEILFLLGNPEKKIKNIIHITGTNGKGSVASNSYNILMQMNYTVGKFISPHIKSCNESIEVNKEQISDLEINRNIYIIKSVCEKHSIEPIYFDVLTVCAILHFAEKNLDFVVIEVGMGGKFDATNIFLAEQKSCVVLNNVSNDHEKFIGPSIEHILINKLNIANNACNLVCGRLDSSLLNLLRNYCNKFEIKNLNILGDEFSYKSYNRYFEFTNIFNTIKIDNQNFLEGNHQLDNLSVSIQTVILSIEKLNKNSLNNLDTSSVRYKSIDEIDFSKINFKSHIARLEEVNFSHIDRLNKSNIKKIYIDGCHNRDGVLALVNFINKNFCSANDHCNIVVGRSKHYDNGENNINFFQPFLSLKSQYTIYCTRVVLESIVESPQVLFNSASSLGLNCYTSNSINEVLNNILHQKSKKNQYIFVCGSLYMARDVYRIMKEDL